MDNEPKKTGPGKGWRRHPKRDEAEALLLELRGDDKRVARELGLKLNTVRHWWWEMGY